MSNSRLLVLKVQQTSTITSTLFLRRQLLSISSRSCLESSLLLLPFGWQQRRELSTFSTEEYLYSTAGILPNQTNPTTHTQDNSKPSSPKTKKGKKKIRHRREDLQRKTDYLIEWCQDNANSEHSITGNPFFEVMQGWMEYCQDHTSKPCALEAAHTSAQLLDVFTSTPSTQNFWHPKHLHMVLEAYAVCGGQRAAAMAAWKLVTAQPEQARTLSMYNRVLQCWARSGDQHAGFHTQVIFQHMCRHGKDKDNSPSCCLPDERSLVSHLQAWACSGHAQAPERVRDTLQRVLLAKSGLLLRDHKNTKNNNPYRNITIDHAVFHTVLYTYVRNGHHHRLRRRAVAMEAERVVATMLAYGLPPLPRTYALVAAAWAATEATEHTGDAAARAQAVYERIDVTTDAAAAAVLVTTCIAAWSHVTGQPEAPERAERLYRSTVATATTTAAANAVLSAWARTRCRTDAVPRALQFFGQLDTPDLISYNTLLDAMAKRGQGRVAMQLLESMKQKDGIQADLVTYNSVLAALSRDRTVSPEEPYRLLKLMEASPSIQADKFSYTSVLNAWAVSNVSDKAHRANAIVQSMVQRYRNSSSRAVRPDAHIFTTLIKACITNNQNKDPSVASIAWNAIRALEHDGFGPPTSISYMLLLRAVRHDDVQKAWTMCTQSGLVSRQVVATMQRVGGTLPSVLEPKWCANVFVGDRPL